MNVHTVHVVILLGSLVLGSSARAIEVYEPLRQWGESPFGDLDTVHRQVGIVRSNGNRGSGTAITTSFPELDGHVVLTAGHCVNVTAQVVDGKQEKVDEWGFQQFSLDGQTYAGMGIRHRLYSLGIGYDVAIILIPDEIALPSRVSLAEVASEPTVVGATVEMAGFAGRSELRHGFALVTDDNVDGGSRFKCSATDRDHRHVAEHGDSGGPVLNSSGTIVGVLSSALDAHTFAASVTGSDVRDFVCGKTLLQYVGQPGPPAFLNLPDVSGNAYWRGQPDATTPLSRKIAYINRPVEARQPVYYDTWYGGSSWQPEEIAGLFNNESLWLTGFQDIESLPEPPPETVILRVGGDESNSAGTFNSGFLKITNCAFETTKLHNTGTITVSGNVVYSVMFPNQTFMSPAALVVKGPVLNSGVIKVGQAANCHFGSLAFRNQGIVTDGDVVLPESSSLHSANRTGAVGAFEGGSASAEQATESYGLHFSSGATLVNESGGVISLSENELTVDNLINDGEMAFSGFRLTRNYVPYPPFVTWETESMALSVATELIVGESGNGGKLALSRGGALVTPRLVLGQNAGSNGDVLISGAGVALCWNPVLHTMDTILVWSNAHADQLVVAEAGQGTLTVDEGARMSADTVIIGAVVGSFGSVTVSGPESTLDVSNSLDVGSGEPGNYCSADLCVADGGLVSVGNTITVWSGDRISLGGGTLHAEKVDIRNGNLYGNGTVEAAVENSGVVDPGTSAGTLTILGDYTQTACGVLSLEHDALGQHDLLDIDGCATLEGTIWIDFASLPDLDDSLVFIESTDALSISDSVSFGFSGLPAGWNAICSAGAHELRVSVTVVPEPATCAGMLSVFLALVAGSLTRRRSASTT
jgi:T5SS/PEP-CTERM-associated repeat protein